MRFVTFSHLGQDRPGLVLDDDTVLDVPAAMAILANAGDGPAVHPAGSYGSMNDIILGGDESIASIRRLVGQVDRLTPAIRPLASVKLRAPIQRTLKNVFCIGRNYVDHVTEGYRAQKLDLKLPEHPQIFTKPATAIIGPGDRIRYDAAVTVKVDYEVELAVVIGRTGRDITEQAALDHVFGYTIINDVTGRDLQRRHDQWFKGKGLDGSCPMGPWIVHRDAVPDPQSLAISLSVNGEVRQSANTSQMIFDIRRIIRDLSRGMTLEAGDVIATGTPSGVGYAMDPPRFLVPGDIVECHVERIGTLTNTVGIA